MDVQAALEAIAADIDLLVDDEMLSSIPAASAEEVESLTAALKN